MSRALARIFPRIIGNEGNALRRVFGPFAGSNWNSPTDYFDREFRHLENMMNRMHNDLWQSFDSSFGGLGNFGRSQDPLRNLFRIVEEDGKRKVRVQFDAENVKPEDIEVKAVGNDLEIRAKSEDKGDYHSIYQEYTRRFTLPQGVKPDEMTCKFENGVVTLEAPYTPPAIEAETINSKQIPIKLEPGSQQQQEQQSKEIPIKREAENQRS